MRFITRLPTATAAVLAITSVLHAQVAPPPPPAQPVADIVINMRQVEIADVAEQISRITGRTLILDPAVKGVVNVTSAEPLSTQGVWDLFQSVLRVHGFAAVRSGRAWRVIPQANALRDAGSGGGAGIRSASGQDVVTRMIRLRNLSTEEAVRVFRPLINGFGSVEGVQNPNAVIVTDYAENVRRIERLALQLDQGGGSVDSVTLRYGTAREVANAIQAILGENMRVVAEDRSNTLLFRGSPTSVAEARRVAARLDQPGGATPTTRLFRLANADAETVTDLLRGLLDEEGGGQATNAAARGLLRRGGVRGQSLGGGGTVAQNLAAAIGSNQTVGTGGANGPGLPTQAVVERAPAGGGAGGTAPRAGFSTPDLNVQASPELNAIVVRGTPTAIAAIEPLIRELDVRRPQVVIEAAIVEINDDEAEQLGVQFGFGPAAQLPNTGGTSFSNIGASLSTILGVLGVPAASLLGNGLTASFSERNDFSVLVQALGSSTKANLLSHPTVTVLDNVPAEIVVGQNVPFVTGSFGTDGNSVNPFTTIERQDVGLTLRVLPRVHEGDVVRLEVSQEVSSLTATTVQGAADLITNRRAIETTVLADDGETIVLGGLVSDDRNTLESRVPVLGDVPVLGNLFRSRREGQLKRTLFVFLRPTILRDSAAAVAATQGSYARIRGEEAALYERGSLLMNPPEARLSMEIEGLY